MNFRTQIPLKEVSNQIDYNSKIVLFGSCFSENINKKLNYFKFQRYSNPFGILFHPVAIENLITHAINEKNYTEDDIFNLNERWHCFDAHSELSNSSKNDLIVTLNSGIKKTYKQLKTASHIVITLGTAWIYRHISSDEIVANCHKVLQKKFLKELLSIDEITASLEASITILKSINKDVNIIFTVSPVRHLKDGFTENTVSKSHLISAINNIVEPRNNTHYFPSYEMMIDDLRDYRFYNADMIHPNATAINYIWEGFKTAWISKNTSAIMTEVDVIQKGLAHKPFNPNSDQHKTFLESLKLKINNLETEHNIVF